MIIAAVRLGLGLAKTKIKSVRFRTSCAVTENQWESSSIFLCFEEIESQFSGYYKNYVVRRIELNDYDTFSDGEEDVAEEELPVIAQMRSKVTEYFRWTNCTVLGSKIVFPYARNRGVYTDVCWIDMANPTKFNVSAQTDSTIKSFTESIIDMTPSSEENSIALLASTVTALIPTLYNSRLSTVFLEDVDKILAWKTGTNSLCFFDVSNPDKGWIRIRDRAFTKYMSTVVNKPLFIYNYRPDIGDFYLMLNYTPYEPLRVSAFFMSDAFDSFSCINIFQLPDSCLNYLDPSDNNNACRPILVELGARNFGLVMNRFSVERKKGSVLLLSFEYDIKTTTVRNALKPNVEIQIRLVGTRRFRYNAVLKTKLRRLYDTCLIGAFLF